MSAHGFKSLFMAASVAGAALGCYLVSLNVASERAELERVEGKIVLAQREIRLLQTEIGTRGRLAQLERWNVGFIRLSAPTADQFLEGGFQLASMVRPAPKPAIEAPIVLASTPVDIGVKRQPSTSDADEAKPGEAARAPAPSAEDLMHIASYQRPAPKPTAITPPKSGKLVAAESAPAKPAGAKEARTASADALAPLPAPRSSAKSTTADGAAIVPTSGKTKGAGTPR